MEPFQDVKSKLIPLDMMNVDTDQIIPKQFLKLIQKTGYGDFLFYDWRYDHGGNPKNGFIFNDPKYNERQVLLTRDNFGCGSSREHAVWALFDYGIRVVIASSFADIFYNNCFKKGLLPIYLSQNEIEYIFNLVHSDDVIAEISLAKQTISVSEKLINFNIDPTRKKMLLEGIDEISFTLSLNDQILDYEEDSRVADYNKYLV
ncbi:MAG: 3-isopropylmalate dehydratase small subunit [Nitrososphaeraceae archaeon]|nr:3-isopropylmalate dehydratase small subunit [Nitrososphaeraceae archaeon]MDW0142176.1 3-isopropylmalate dehydratase small subunit [Nitrososphaeraceae archaeon]MDW0151946.1 3-isopropylmalate dehydratase small subunit [Nitrososphaeraceae archaeon]MDW0153769.1 3-isopropylmalate dehydratase small subunit [Nitrososphaeraceae archaeon]MDW0157809.1 3-isopropylmalate dehydratase small subunit [Nitrososphaeraceae archaeon]